MVVTPQSEEADREVQELIERLRRHRESPPAEAPREVYPVPAYDYCSRRYQPTPVVEEINPPETNPCSTIID